MNWLTQHSDAVVLIIFMIVVFASYSIGREIGYVEGLEDGYKDGQLNA